MKREVAAEIVDSLKEAGVDFVATLTEANLHDLVIALGEDSAIHHVPAFSGVTATKLPPLLAPAFQNNWAGCR